jgi:hypothetical protein
MKRGFCADIEDLTEANEDFRRVLYTGEHLQLVLMTLQPGPPQHKDGIVHATRAEAEQRHHAEKWDGGTTE